MGEPGLSPVFSEQSVAKAPELVPSAEPPKAPVAPAPEAPPVSAAIAPQVDSVGFESGMAGGEGDGTAATNKSSKVEVDAVASAAEVTPPVDNEVNKYMTAVQETMFLPEGDPAREAKMLEFMGKIEAAKASGELEAAVIGEGRGRAIILEKPAQSVIKEPAHMSPDNVDLRFGDMTTVRDTYLAVNRKGFTGIAVTTDQSVQIDPNAEMFSAQGAYSGKDPFVRNSVGNPTVGMQIFERNYGGWLKECEGNVKRSGLNVQRRIDRLKSMKDYQPRPDAGDKTRYPTGGILGLVQVNEQYIEDGEAWSDSDSVRPDGMWAGFIQIDDKFIDTPTTRMPGNHTPWFDVAQQRPTFFVVKNPETVEKTLRANIIESKLQPPVISQPPAI